MKIWSYFKEIAVGLGSLIQGLGVTFAHLFKKPVTVQYPHVRLKMPENFRGAIQFKIFPETQTHNCIACLLCAKTCPTHCYEIEGAKTPEGKKRPTKFIYNYLQCSKCNLCIQVCPTQTLENSREYETAAYSKDPFQQVDFIEKAEQRARQQGVTA